MSSEDTSRPRVAIIGAAGGIGSALSKRLAASGAHLHLAGRSEDPLRALADELDAPFEALDAQDFDAVEGFVAKASEDGALRGLVNLAGSILLKPAHRTTRKDLDEALGQNVATAFATVRAAAQHMRREGGSVVLMASSASTVGLPNHEAIAAAKGGVAAIAQAAAASYATNGLRVNALAPGLVRTPMSRRITENERSLEASIAMHPLGRIGEPDDVASLITWLVSEESSWVTGQVWSIDGGLASLKGR
jgi:NAD(P)-dependent dehydrogenase (short-subunit alcohol dehydrogenase family)